MEQVSRKRNLSVGRIFWQESRWEWKIYEVRTLRRCGKKFQRNTSSLVRSENLPWVWKRWQRGKLFTCATLETGKRLNPKGRSNVQVSGIFGTRVWKFVEMVEIVIHCGHKRISQMRSGNPSYFLLDGSFQFSIGGFEHVLRRNLSEQSFPTRIQERFWKASVYLWNGIAQTGF